MDPKPYLDYLDKEMMIMGILSAFAVAAPAGILVTSIGKDSKIAGQFWDSAEIFIVFGSIYCVVAALGGWPTHDHHKSGCPIRNTRLHRGWVGCRAKRAFRSAEGRRKAVGRRD
jgi:hypothetical protein